MFAFLPLIGGVFGLKGKAAGIVGALVTIVAVVGLLWGAKALYDHSVISNHDAKQAATTAKADRKADTHAGEQRRADDTRLSTETQQLNQVETAHAQDNPTARRVARQRCLRLQQSARAAGRQPPACT